MASLGVHEVHDDCTSCSSPAGAFCDVSPASRAALYAIKFTAFYPRGAVLFGEGESPRGVFILCSGRVKLATSSTGGKTLIMRIAKPGEILGASAAINDGPYEVSAETIEPSQLTFVKRNDFLRLLHGNSEIALNTVRQLSAKYHDAQREIRSLGLAQTTSEKLAALLLEWSAAHGAPTPRGIRLYVVYTHEQIAQMIGSTRETVTRVLAEFRHTGQIEINGAALVLRDVDALRAMITT